MNAVEIEEAVSVLAERPFDAAESTFPETIKYVEAMISDHQNRLLIGIGHHWQRQGKSEI